MTFLWETGQSYLIHDFDDGNTEPINSEWSEVTNSGTVKAQTNTVIEGSHSLEIRQSSEWKIKRSSVVSHDFGGKVRYDSNQDESVFFQLLSDDESDAIQMTVDDDGNIYVTDGGSVTNVANHSANTNYTFKFVNIDSANGTYEFVWDGDNKGTFNYGGFDVRYITVLRFSASNTWGVYFDLLEENQFNLL